MDVCVLDDTYSILLVVNVDRHLRESDLGPRLISSPIAAFHNDNIIHAKRSCRDPLTGKVTPGIVMDGTMPTFYRIPITSELATAVESGEPPEEDTIVRPYRPEVPRPGEGMKPLDNRSITLSCFQDFKQFM